MTTDPAGPHERRQADARTAKASETQRVAKADAALPATPAGKRASGAAKRPKKGGARAPLSETQAPLGSDDLIARIREYDSRVNGELIAKAYDYAKRAHADQSRHSGDPYFHHPVEVAQILTELKADHATIATALLHDVIEDTGATKEGIEEEFGAEIAQLVDGVTKLTRIELRSEATKQAENFRKLVLAMSRDVRVLLVKLADRLHNMRTLHHMPRPESRARIASETMEIYAPLAGRMGVHRIREQLEALAFEELNPSARTSIMRRLDYLRPRASRAIEEIAAKLQAKLKEQGVEARVVTREKRPYSIWRKMEEKNISFEQLADIYGVRIIVNDLKDCYRALGVIHSEWRYIPGCFKDYVSTPKPNNYRSIHTAVWGPDMQQVELQIRTFAMNEVAERGVAAHWRYKDPELKGDENTAQVVLAEEGGPKGHDPYHWVHSVVKMLEHGDDPEEFLEHTKLELFQDHVFCFTPKGRLIELPRGATPIDFAYAVHTDVGDTCVGAKVNGRPAPLRTPLRNGDMVEILRSSKAQPPPNWESLVVTGRARSAIRRLIRRSEKDEYAKLGREIVVAAASGEGLDITIKAVRAALGRLNLPTVDDVFEKVGRGDLSVEDLLATVFPGRPEEKREAFVRPSSKPAVGPEGVVVGEGGAVPISGLQQGVVVHMAPCCSPLPGDRIVGIRTPGKGVVIHTIDCERLAQDDPPQERWIDLKWRGDASKAVSSVGSVITTVRNERGVLGEISNVIAAYRGNISNVRITNREVEFFDVQVDIEVADVRHLTNIVAALRASPSVIEVHRVRG